MLDTELKRLASQLRDNVPLRLCVGAANHLPEDESLAAFADRFLLHLFIESVPDSKLEALLEGGWQVDRQQSENHHALSALDELGKELHNVDLSVVRAELASAIRVLRATGIQLSDRRIVKSQRLIAAASLLRGSLQASPCDLWPIFYVLPTQALQFAAQEALSAQLALASNPTLSAAVEFAARQPASRITRLLEQAETALTQSMLEMGSVLKEIDANFSSESLPDELRGAREALVNAFNRTTHEQAQA